MRFAEQQKSRHHGFSLVELSIVLVILGLLVGGVLSGRSLIRAAEIRSIVTEYETWQTAVNSYKLRFRQLPGDMNNATSFWAGTTNGNGDGRVFFHPLPEIFLFWQHMALAGVIPGKFTGVSGPGSNEHVFIGENVPPSKVSGAGWSLAYISPAEVYAPQFFNIEYKHSYQYGGPIPDYETQAPIITPAEAWSIDSKIDDGKPAQGFIIARYWDNACANASTNLDLEAIYRASDDRILCALFFRNPF